MGPRRHAFVFAFLAVIGLFAGAAPARATPTIGPALDVRQFGAVCDGVTDDSAAFASAATAAATAGVNMLTAGAPATPTTGTRCYLASGFTVPANLYFTCEGAPSRAGTPATETGDYTTTPNALILKSTATLTLSQGSQVDHCAILRQNLNVSGMAPASTQDLLTNVAAFAGTGVTFSGDGSALTNSMVLGFATGITSVRNRENFIQNVGIDATTCSDIESQRGGGRIVLDDVYCQPFATASSNASLDLPVSSYSNCGGNICVTLSSACTVGTTCPNTGQTAWVNTNTQAQSATGRWVVTRNSTTSFTLNSSTSAALSGGAGITLTGNLDGFSNEITALSLSGTCSAGTSNCQIYPGQSISGTGIPGGTTITAFWPAYGILWLSAKTTASGSGVGLTILDATSGTTGDLSLSATERTGDGFYFANTNDVSVVGCSALAHYTGIHWGDGSRQVMMEHCGVDQDNTLWDPNFAGILADHAPGSNLFIDGYCHVSGSCIVSRITGNSPLGANIVAHSELGAPDQASGLFDVVYNLGSGSPGTACNCRWVFTGNNSRTTSFGFISDDVTQTQFDNNSEPTVTLLTQSEASLGNTYIGTTDEFPKGGSIPVNDPTIAITAHAGGGQASATLLPSVSNRVNGVATAGDSVALMPAGVHWCQRVTNSAANAATVYAQGSDTINALSAGTGFSLPGQSSATFCVMSLGKYWTQ